MAFSTLIFLFAFLPASLLLYHLVPKALKNPVLLVCSLVFYAWGTPEYLAILLFSVVFNYCAGLFLAGGIRESGRRGGVIRPTAGLLFAVGVNVALLCLFKYWAGLCGLINTLLGTSLPPGPAAAHRAELLYLQRIKLPLRCLPGQNGGPEKPAEIRPFRDLLPQGGLRPHCAVRRF